MSECDDAVPFLVLVDDDDHSAQLLMRTLYALGSPPVRRYGDAATGRAELDRVLGDCGMEWPGLVIVDLKSHSAANLDFVSGLRTLTLPRGVPVVVMAHALDRTARDALHAAGAAAVFFRQAERDAYRREAAGILSFWARYQRLDAVGM